MNATSAKDREVSAAAGGSQAAEARPAPEIKAAGSQLSIAMLREHLPDEYEQVMARLDEQTRTTLTGGYLATEWIPLDVYARYLDAQVAVSGRDPRALMLERGGIVFRKDFSLFHKMIILITSPEMLFKRLAALNSTFFRGIEVEIRALEKGKAVLRYTGFRKQHETVGLIVISFFQTVLELGGTKGIQADFTTPIGHPSGHAELTVTWR